MLLDTHIAVRWLIAPKRLSRDQLRVLREAMRRNQPVAISAISVLEIAVLFGAGSRRGEGTAAAILAQIGSDPAFQVLPLSVDIAAEVAAMGPALQDPADRAIVATAHIQKLTLVTSDQRILDSGLVPVVA